MPFRYVPRAYLIEPHEFGWRRAPDFINPGNNLEQRAIVWAARTQHKHMTTIRKHMREHHIRIGDLATTTGMDRSKISDIINGARPVSLSDLGLLIAIRME